MLTGLNWELLIFKIRKGILDTNVTEISAKMSAKHSLAYLVLTNWFLKAFSTAFYSGEFGEDCSGTLVVWDNTGAHQYDTTVENIEGGIISERVVMEGCGCYMLYQGARRMGRVYYITRSGEHLLPFSRIGSIYRENCGQSGHKNDVVFTLGCSSTVLQVWRKRCSGR